MKNAKLLRLSVIALCLAMLCCLCGCQAKEGSASNVTDWIDRGANEAQGDLFENILKQYENNSFLVKRYYNAKDGRDLDVAVSLRMQIGGGRRFALISSPWTEKATYLIEFANDKDYQNVCDSDDDDMYENLPIDSLVMLTSEEYEFISIFRPEQTAGLSDDMRSLIFRFEVNGYTVYYDRDAEKKASDEFVGTHSEITLYKDRVFNLLIEFASEDDYKAFAEQYNPIPYEHRGLFVLSPSTLAGLPEETIELFNADTTDVEVYLSLLDYYREKGYTVDFFFADSESSETLQSVYPGIERSAAIVNAANDNYGAFVILFQDEHNSEQADRRSQYEGTRRYGRLFFSGSEKDEPELLRLYDLWEAEQ